MVEILQGLTLTEELHPDDDGCQCEEEKYPADAINQLINQLIGGCANFFLVPPIEFNIIQTSFQNLSSFNRHNLRPSEI